MKRNLPPLNALKAFEASARLLSFSKAAAEMRITQGAVSKQVKLLEDYFGKILFERVNRGLKLTPKAEKYYANLSMAFDSIASWTEEMKISDENTINIHSFVSFAYYWLLPHIQDFKNQNPDINIQIITGFGADADIKEIDADIVIWGYKHSFKNADYEKLIDEEMLLVCAPNLISTPIKKIKDIIKYPFLKNNYRKNAIPNWLKSHGLKKDAVKIGLSFDYLYMQIEAAKQGLGMALAPEFLVQDLIKNRQLINPLNIKFKGKFKYYVVYPKKSSQTKNARKFSKWMIEELQKR